MDKLKYYYNRPVTVERWHRLHIHADFRRLKGSLFLYLGYKLQFVLKYYKKIVDYTNLVKRRKDSIMSSNLKYWRENGALVVANDETEAFKSHADGKMYTSKAAYRHELKGRGFEEVGNDSQEPTEQENYYANLAKENDIKQDIKEALNGRRN